MVSHLSNKLGRTCYHATTQDLDVPRWHTLAARPALGWAAQHVHVTRCVLCGPTCNETRPSCHNTSHYHVHTGNELEQCRAHYTTAKRARHCVHTVMIKVAILSALWTRSLSRPFAAEGGFGLACKSRCWLCRAAYIRYVLPLFSYHFLPKPSLRLSVLA